MPELPEVETTLRGITPHALGKRIIQIHVRNHSLRWRVELPEEISGQKINRITRRAKYLLLHADTGGLILHLGMSGRLSVVSNNAPAGKHDHIDILLEHGQALRLTDPRRFGSIHWQSYPLSAHWLLEKLGIEPLHDEFSGDYLFKRSRARRSPVKTFLMDAHVVVGIGNIYANEALFHSGIRPRIAAGRISQRRYAILATTVKSILTAAIDLGGTTLRDFLGGDGTPGYFAQKLCVYGRAGQRCRVCGTTLKGVRSGQRGTVYCPKCQR
jgi:formamidopyrimidine-DNA glycosylase